MTLPQLNPLLVEDAVRAALAEDFGRAGDITSQATIPASAQATAVIAARKKPGVLAGLDLAREAFRPGGSRPALRGLAAPTATISRRARSWRASKVRPASLLSAERVALNFLGRLCGIATLTAHYAEAVAHTKAQDLLHAQNHARPARLREICGALRRRHEPPLRPR